MMRFDARAFDKPVVFPVYSNDASINSRREYWFLVANITSDEEAEQAAMSALEGTIHVGETVKVTVLVIKRNSFLRSRYSADIDQGGEIDGRHDL